jgi:hypothetical protein
MSLSSGDWIFGSGVVVAMTKKGGGGASGELGIEKPQKSHSTEKEWITKSSDQNSRVAFGETY